MKFYHGDRYKGHLALTWLLPSALSLSTATTYVVYEYSGWSFQLFILVHVFVAAIILLARNILTWLNSKNYVEIDIADGYLASTSLYHSQREQVVVPIDDLRYLVKMRTLKYSSYYAETVHGELCLLAHGDSTLCAWL